MTVARVSTGLHIAHVIICFATFGFIFPHALMENEVSDVAPIDQGKPPPARSADPDLSTERTQ